MDIDALPPRYQKQIIEQIKTQERRKKSLVPSKVKKPSKYHNVKTVIDGIEFDSKAEAERYQELKIMQLSGEIQGFARQVSFPLFTNRYIVDFLVQGECGELWAEDVKGVETDVFRIKKREFEKIYPWIELRILK